MPNFDWLVCVKTIGNILKFHFSNFKNDSMIHFASSFLSVALLLDARWGRGSLLPSRWVKASAGSAIWPASLAGKISRFESAKTRFLLLSTFSSFFAGTFNLSFLETFCAFSCWYICKFVEEPNWKLSSSVMVIAKFSYNLTLISKAKNAFWWEFEGF